MRDADASPEALLRAGYRYALALVHRPERAEDLLQDAWVSVLQAGGRLQRGYLFRAIRSRFIDAHRRAGVAVIEPVEPGLLEERLSSEPDPELDCAFALPAGALEAALGELRPEEREVLFLAVIEGYTAREIAELMERPRGTVLSWLHRAKGRLAERLAGSEQEAST